MMEGSMTDAISFEAHRPALFALAYRMLGSANEAEDVLQDAFLRVHTAARDDVRAPRAYVAHHRHAPVPRPA